MSDTATLLLVIAAAVAVSMVVAVVIVRRSQSRADAALAQVSPPDRRTTNHSKLVGEPRGAAVPT